MVTDYATGSTAPPIPVISAVPEADKDNAAFPAEVSLAGYPTGNYVVTFVLYAPNGTELDRMDSEVITLY